MAVNTFMDVPALVLRKGLAGSGFSSFLSLFLQTPFKFVQFAINLIVFAPPLWEIATRCPQMGVKYPSGESKGSRVRGGGCQHQLSDFEPTRTQSYALA